MGFNFNIRFAESCNDFIEASQITGHGQDRAGMLVVAG